MRATAGPAAPAGAAIPWGELLHPRGGAHPQKCHHWRCEYGGTSDVCRAQRPVLPAPVPGDPPAKILFSWNWSAFFLNFFYFFYRKMYLVGGVLMLVSMVTMIPSVVFTNEYMKLFLQSITGQVIPYNEELMIQMSSIQQYIRIGQMALSLTLGMFANKLYLNHAQKVIRKTKEEFGEGSPACLTGIATRGRTNMTMVLLVLCWMIFLYFAISFAITNNIISIL
nr:DUF2628 domain-containing protein [Merdimmobilis hominis]